jgi:hypothetical protein
MGGIVASMSQNEQKEYGCLGNEKLKKGEAAIHSNGLIGVKCQDRKAMSFVSSFHDIKR